MNVNLPHIVTISDLFCNFDVKKLKGKGNIKRTHKCEDKKALAKKIFMRYMYYLMVEMIKGGKTFMFPYKQYMELKFRMIPDYQFKQAIRAGAYANVDVIASNFRCYEMILSYKNYGFLTKAGVKLSHNFRDMIADKVNEGLIYC